MVGHFADYLGPKTTAEFLICTFSSGRKYKVQYFTWRIEFIQHKDCETGTLNSVEGGIRFVI
jgi:hypothetical protein